MIILGIETSCDETAISIVAAAGSFPRATFSIIAHVVHSQVPAHRPYGGVFPSLAKREHAVNLIPVLAAALQEAAANDSRFVIEEGGVKAGQRFDDGSISQILAREPLLLTSFRAFVPHLGVPPFDVIAVTEGPGLEPALWVGINFARALSACWKIPLVPVNHMEGHIFAALLPNLTEPNTAVMLRDISFPAIALLISGGHTELILMEGWGRYRTIGETRDDAVGEAFDKVARILGLPYPGGPEVSRLAEAHRRDHPDATARVSPYPLPRPMIDSPNLDFSFAGLKTAALYTVRRIPALTGEIRREIAREFEDAVADVLEAKVSRALRQHRAQTLIISGGVIANANLRRRSSALAAARNVILRMPSLTLSTDNAIMIAVAGYFHLTSKEGARDHKKHAEIKARGTAKLSS